MLTIEQLSVALRKHPNTPRTLPQPKTNDSAVVLCYASYNTEAYWKLLHHIDTVLTAWSSLANVEVMFLRRISTLTIIDCKSLLSLSRSSAELINITCTYHIIVVTLHAYICISYWTFIFIFIFYNVDVTDLINGDEILIFPFFGFHAFT